jgi:hypothetical protein
MGPCPANSFHDAGKYGAGNTGADPVKSTTAHGAPPSFLDAKTLDEIQSAGRAESGGSHGAGNPGAAPFD